jgi:hypothetical protein
MNRGSSAFAATAVPPGPPPGYAARVTGGVLLPVFTLLSAVWFAAMAIGLLSAWWVTQHIHLGVWPYGDWFNVPDVPRWVALVVILLVYALIAMPIGAARKASLYYANGGRLHGWADAWSGLLWIAVVAALLLAAWQFLPHLHEVLRHTGHGHTAVINL